MHALFSLKKKKATAMRSGLTAVAFVLLLKSTPGAKLFKRPDHAPNCKITLFKRHLNGSGLPCQT
ncbi:MAG: hypothetical protein EDM70_11870 [Candidatus Brocadia sp. AMX2]|nr:MAG: hypothetical protein EDM70_11870 [Candidatus Brocadia sp. AMX2]